MGMLYFISFLPFTHLNRIYLFIYLLLGTQLFSCKICICLVQICSFILYLLLDVIRDASGAARGCPPRVRMSRNSCCGVMRQPAWSRFPCAGVAAACVRPLAIQRGRLALWQPWRRPFANAEKSIIGLAPVAPLPLFRPP
jgi:hypothetical protein